MKTLHAAAQTEPAVCLESLEPRLLMSGNVVARIQNGLLQLTGDRKANAITIDQAGLAAGQFRVSASDSDTTVNGHAGSVVFDAVTGLNIRMGNGADDLSLQNLQISGDVTISMGTGKNVLNVQTVTASGKVVFVGGSGQDAFTIDTLTCDNAAGVVSVRSGAGSDNVTITNSQFSGGLQINMGAGNNNCQIKNVSVLLDLEYRSRGGDDIVDLDTFTQGRYVYIFTGGGNDGLFLRNDDVHNYLGVLLGKGNDMLYLDDGTKFEPYGTFDHNSPGGPHQYDLYEIFGGSGYDRIVTDSVQSLQLLSVWSFEKCIK